MLKRLLIISLIFVSCSNAVEKKKDSGDDMDKLLKNITSAIDKRANKDNLDEKNKRLQQEQDYLKYNKAAKDHFIRKIPEFKKTINRAIKANAPLMYQKIQLDKYYKIGKNITAFTSSSKLLSAYDKLYNVSRKIVKLKRIRDINIPNFQSYSVKMIRETIALLDKLTGIENDKDTRPKIKKIDKKK